MMDLIHTTMATAAISFSLGVIVATWACGPRDKGKGEQ